ncbi:MAG: hypothetical protein HC904_13385 [Blastochloris sp.]|nr:hypothetical protein [Blastochloris sp.]
MLTITDSQASVNFGVYQSAYPLLVRETVNGVTREALRADMPTRGNGNSVPLFVAGPPYVPTPPSTVVTVADYKFTSGSLTSSDTHEQSLAGSISSGGGSGYSISATALTGRLRATTTNNNPNSADAKVANGQHTKFTVSGVAGRRLYPKSMQLGIRREGSSPDRLTVYATTNGSTFEVLMDNVAVPSTSAFQNILNNNLASFPALQNAASITLVIVFHGGSTGLTNGRNDIDNVLVTSAVTD